MRTLYEMTEDFRVLLSMVDDPEIDQQAIFDTLESIDMELEDKADGYAKVMAEMDAEEDGIDKQIERLKARKNALQNNKQAMKDRLKNAMIQTGKTRFKTALFSFSVANNGGKTPIKYTVEPEKLPEEFRTAVTTYKANDGAIRQYLDSGKQSEFFAYGERGTNLRIK